MIGDHRALGRSAAFTTVVILATAASIGCSTSGSVGGGKPTSASASLSASLSTSASASAQDAADATVTKSEAASALTAYQGANNTVNAALDLAGEAKIEAGSLLTLDQGSLRYAQGYGGDLAAEAKVPQSFTDPVFYPVRTATYPRGFFVTVKTVQSGESDAATLLHFTQDHTGAPWLVDTNAILTAGKQWPAFAVASDGTLDYGATRLDKLRLSTTDLVAADRLMLSNGDAGQSGSPFAKDDVTTAQRKWMQDGVTSTSPANVSMTVSTALDPMPTYLPLKDGGELAVYGTRISLHVTQPGRTFTLGDPGWAKVAGTSTVVGAFTIDSLWMVAAIVPPDKAGTIQKIAYNGGLVSLTH